MIVREPEFTQLAERVATAVKTEALRRQPCMDEVAVALNCHPTNSEVIAIKRILRLVQQAGYEIHRKD